MNRRTLLLAFAAFPLCADDAQQVWDLFTQLAAALSAANSAEFLKPFDPSMPGYAIFEADVTGLVRHAEVHSSIELLSDEETGPARTVELDWLLRLVDLHDTGVVTQRRERVRCRLVKQNKKWRITSIEPLSFFAPPK